MKIEEMDETHTDFVGMPRRFRTALLSTPEGLLAEAVEQTKASEGCRASAVGPFDNPAMALGALWRKLDRILNTRHLARHDGTGGRIATHDVLRGRIGCDLETRGPVIVIDGEPLSWEEFGKTLLTHEGFDFELRLLG